MLHLNIFRGMDSENAEVQAVHNQDIHLKYVETA